MKMVRDKQDGFTLIELMIAVAIVSIAVSLAIPDLLRWYVQRQLRQATTEIATQLTLARMVGMNRNKSVDVTVSSSGGVVRVSTQTASGVAINDISVPSRVKSVVGSPVSFSSMGTRTSNGTGAQTIGVCDRYGRQYSVTITASGKVNWAPTATADPCP